MGAKMSGTVRQCRHAPEKRCGVWRFPSVNNSVVAGMSEDSIHIEVDGRKLSARKGHMLIQVTDANAIYIPRFCYHHKLSVAANCRMCLVEVERAPKPLPACATPVMDGMVVHTRSEKALSAQKGVMEFLLINHPLDCPICDQGGECELQDLAMGYGRDVSRYHEKKRVVRDRDIGTLIQTDMTRCIHCTRCVRFGEEVAGLRELGATGRGEHMEIGTYIQKSVRSEMSGNVIDLCPVGALTSKPFRYSARSWELVQKDGIAPHDGLGSALHFHCRGDQVMRVVPAENEQINEVWLSDRDRYSYEGLYSKQRLLVPEYRRSDGQWQQTNWEDALRRAQDGLQAVLGTGGGEWLGVLAAGNQTLQEYYLLQKMARALDCPNIDHRHRQRDFSAQQHAPLAPLLGREIAELEELNAVLLVGSNPRKDHPLVNSRLRKAVCHGACQVMALNMLDHEFNYPLAMRWIASPYELPVILLALLKAAGESEPQCSQWFTDIEVDERHHRALAALAREPACILLGSGALMHPHYAWLEYLCSRLAQLTGASLGYLAEAANSVGAWQMGMLPHRLPAGGVSQRLGLDAWQMLEQPRRAYLLMGLEPELDCWDGAQALNAMRQAEFVVGLTAFVSEQMREYANVLLPIALYAENAGGYINIAGTVQNFTAAVRPPSEARPGWKVLRVLAQQFSLPGFDWVDLEQIDQEITPLLSDMPGSPSTPAPASAWRPAQQAGSDMLQRITEVPMNALDALVRRAPALQAGGNDVADGAVHINAETALRCGLSEGVMASLEWEHGQLPVPVIVDATVPDNCVLVHAGQMEHARLGGGIGCLRVQALRG